MASADIALVTKGNAEFANKFYNILSREDGNILFSPLSVHTVLSMAYQGAANETAKQFASTLRLPDYKVAAKGYNAIMNMLNNIEHVTLHIANKVFVKNDFSLKSQFKQAVTELFLSETESMDFGKKVECALKINKWVEDKTNSKIKDLISPDNLDSNTCVVLVNAIYFKGNWLHKFDKTLTKTEPFYVTKETKIDCQMMHIFRDFTYCIDNFLNAKVLQLPYENANVSMIVILPNSDDGIEELEKKLVDFDLTKLTQRMIYDEVNLSLPRFKIEATIDMKPVLEEMGLKVIFDNNKADFSEMAENNGRLYVSDVVQKAFIEVNEEGSEAAAATEMGIMLCCLREPLQFIANHPFVVLLQVKHEDCVNVLFCGKIMKPQ